MVPTADCGKLREKQQSLREELEALEASVRAAAPAQEASHALAEIANSVRAAGGDTKDRAQSADRTLQAARLFVTALAHLVDAAHGPSQRALAEIDRAQAALARLNGAIDRLEAVLAVAESDVQARMEGVRAFLAEAHLAVPDLMAVPGVASIVEQLDHALEVMISWSERIAAARERAGVVAKLLPAVGLALPAFGEHDEDDANVARLRRSLAELDHDLLECGDRPTGPECLDCGTSDVDKAIGRAFKDTAAKAKKDVLDRVGTSADLVMCRTALRELQALDREIAEARLALLDESADGDGADLEALLARRRHLRRAFPAIVFRYRNAAKSFKDAALGWRDEVGNRLQSIATEDRWSPDAIRHVQTCHSDLDDPKLRTLLTSAVEPRSLPKNKMLVVVPVVVVLLVVAAIVASALGGGDSSTEDAATTSGDSSDESSASGTAIDLGLVDACSLLTEADVQEVTGSTEPFQSSGSGQRCFWAIPRPGFPAYVEITLSRSQKGLSGSSFNINGACTIEPINGVGTEAEGGVCPGDPQSKLFLRIFERDVILTILVNEPDRPLTPTDLVPTGEAILATL